MQSPLSRPLSRPRFHLVLAGLTAVALSACSGAYYQTMERLGIEKREILVDRVENARDSQEQAKEQFRSALEEFNAVLEFDGGDLEALYDSVREEYEDSQREAERVRERISAVEEVSSRLFAEWESELSEYSNETLRRASADSLRETREHYEEMIRAMRDAESRMQPVLDAYQDQVLFLKHNLNSRAIASLRDELLRIETDIDDLIASMEAAIAESNRFIQQMNLE